MYEMESAHEKKYLRVAIYLRLSDEDKDKANKLDDVPNAMKYYKDKKEKER